MVLLGAGCSKSDDQRQFEDQARTEPSGITEMTAGGEPVSNKEDPDDWHVAPMFAGYVEVEKPAFPNPVSFNSNLRIELSVLPGLDNLQYIEVWAFEFPNQFHPGPLATIDNVSSSQLLTLNLTAGNITGSSGGSGASGTYRLMLYDGRENLISYGDVRVEN